ncbi:hypothetical protein PPERSA_07296 [Pseudocohnilembus persalinus]|uniref:Uncharacterized protein n=1 Tax=Pseudocohnilembus persalinus TaxID=266149 RepID=A0A0V0QG99_PSEPJ|nr:hypothetical protein PPERSA_07296 [Pseudocohnilembus persalinus]|eukprot:KRX01257.1 hypothetical protein PPERSA_07296 [Pseudocohnilembus persalinus]
MATVPYPFQFVDPVVEQIKSLSAPDPYYIVPFVTIGCYYYNLQRFITPENKHTFISKLRNIGQVLMILWLPLLSNWPSAIQWYMLSNAIISIIQTTIIIQPQFLRYIEPKMLLYQYMLRIVEFDKTQSETLVESIKNGEESLKDKAISEELLVAQTEEMLKKLNAEIYDDLEHYTSNVQQQEPTNQQQDKIIYNQELKF